MAPTNSMYYNANLRGMVKYDILISALGRLLRTWSGGYDHETQGLGLACSKAGEAPLHGAWEGSIPFWSTFIP